MSSNYIRDLLNFKRRDLVEGVEPVASLFLAFKPGKDWLVHRHIQFLECTHILTSHMGTESSVPEPYLKALLLPAQI